MKIKCTTLFDITFTGITGHYKPSRIPLWDRSGATITDQQTWDRARNQQRNWETILQIVSLRTQVSTCAPEHASGQWSFSFETDLDQLFDNGADPLGVLKQDCARVPMLVGLGESSDIGNLLIPEQNIWFEIVE